MQISLLSSLWRGVRMYWALTAWCTARSPDSVRPLSGEPEERPVGKLCVLLLIGSFHTALFSRSGLHLLFNSISNKFWFAIAFLKAETFVASPLLSAVLVPASAVEKLGDAERLLSSSWFSSISKHQNRISGVLTGIKTSVTPVSWAICSAASSVRIDAAEGPGNFVEFDKFGCAAGLIESSHKALKDITREELLLRL